MDYKTHRTYHTSKVWLIITLLVFGISLSLMQIMYHTADIKPDFDMGMLTMSYLLTISLCIISLTLTHFQKLKLGAIIGMIVGINLITNLAFTDIIMNSAEAIIKLFEPIFSLLPNLGETFGLAQFTVIMNIINIVQIVYGVFLIAIHIPVLLSRDEFRHI